MEDTLSPTLLRVAVVTGSLELGGATTFLCNLGGELVRRGIPIEVLSFETHNPLASDFRQLGIPVFTPAERPQIFEDRMLGILRRLRQFKPAVVLANLSPTSFEVLRYMPAGIFRAGIAHADDPKVYEMMRRYAPHLDLAGVVSETIRRKMTPLAEFAKVPVRYLPLGVPMPAAAPARDFTGPLRILYLGRLDREQKRAHLFPAILAQLQASGIPFHWTLAGDGSERISLEREMKSAPPDQTVLFAGVLAYSQVPSVLSNHNVFLLASEYEGLPLSLVEAMGSGMVPVVSDLDSGIRELVDETIGRRVARDDIAGYAQSIVWLHEHRDPLREMSRKARERVQQEFSVSAMADRWLGSLPLSSNPGISWPKKWSIQPPLMIGKNWRFSWPGRLLRRMALTVRGGG